MPRYDKIPTYLNPEQRHALTQIPSDLSERDIARYYTFTEKERELINRRRRASNRLGFAVQLALLKFPGRTLMEVKDVPRPVLTAIAEQVDVPASAFASYGERENTLYEHLDELRRECGFRACGWREYLLVARSLLADAMESDRPLPLIETALERLRTEGILAPTMIHVERLVWVVLKIAERRLLRTLTQSLTLEQRTRLDSLLYADTSIRGATRLSWLRQAPSVTSPKSIKQLVERLLYLRELSLPALPIALHQNRVLQLARKCSKYQAQPLLNLSRDRRHALLVAYLFELSQDLTDQALDQFDKLLGELLRKGERRKAKAFADELASDEQSSHDLHQSDRGIPEGSDRGERSRASALRCRAGSSVASDGRFRETIPPTGGSRLAGSDWVSIRSDATEFALPVSGPRFSALSSQRTVFTSVGICLQFGETAPTGDSERAADRQGEDESTTGSPHEAMA